jgi:putative transposase
VSLLDQPLPGGISQRMACDALNMNRNTVRKVLMEEHFCGPLKSRDLGRTRSKQPRALSEEQRQTITEVLNSDEYVDQPPMQIYHNLLEQGIYYCSVSTMHRILRDNQMQGERRHQRPPQHHAIPRLTATKPNEVWTWDITKLATKKSGEYLSLYVIMDLFSRYITAWMLSRKENSALAIQLMQQASERYRIQEGSLTLHQDRGAPMTAHCYLDLLSELAITASHSRPRVSNDNPMSESQFKTMKFQPDYPRRFNDYGHAQRWCEDYVSWYNKEHHHSNLAGYTPEQVFTGEYHSLVEVKQDSLNRAFEAYPERFVKGAPKAPMPPRVVSINPIPNDAEVEVIEKGVNFPTLSRVMANRS